MAELLIRNGDNGDWLDGYVVAVRPDGASWGVKEDVRAWVAAGHDVKQHPNKLFVVRLPELSVEKAEEFLSQERAYDQDGNVVSEAIFLRKLRFRLSDLTVQTRLNLTEDKYTDTEKTELLSTVRETATGKTVDYRTL